MTLLDEADKDFEILERAGSGLDGAIYRGRQISLLRNVAIKVIHPEMAHVADPIKHARALVAAGAHPNLVTTFLVTTVRHPITKELVDVIVMEWLVGEQLGQRWSGLRFTLKEATLLCNGILDGMEYLHSKDITHGDLHPGNIMWTSAGPRLIDLDYADQKSLPRATSMSKALRLKADISAVGYVISQSLKRSDIDQEHLATRDSDIRDAITLGAIRLIVADVLEHSTTTNKLPVLIRFIEPLVAAIDAIENGHPARELRIQRYMKWLNDELKEIAPDFTRTEVEGDRALDDDLIEAIEKSTQLVAGFSQLAETVVMVGQKVAASEVYRGLAPLLAKYDLPVDFPGGTVKSIEFDFFKFIGHELFTSFLSLFIRNDRYELLNDVLEEQLYIENLHISGLVPEEYFSDHVELLRYRNKRLKLTRLSSSFAFCASVVDGKHEPRSRCG
jgi:serine/threonine protein kinase